MSHLLLSTLIACSLWFSSIVGTYAAIIRTSWRALQSNMMLGSLSTLTSNNLCACGTADRASQITSITAAFMFDGQAQCSIPVRVHWDEIMISTHGPKSLSNTSGSRSLRGGS